MSGQDLSTLAQVSPGLTKERLSRALTEWFREDVEFTHWDYISEIGKGDSYLSELMKIKIYGKIQDGTPKHVQVILKKIPQNISKRLTLRSDEFFRNEIDFYETVLPALLKFQASKNITDPFDNHAKVFLTYSDGINDVICLEDETLDDFGSSIPL